MDLTPQQRISFIKSGLRHPFWSKVLKPYLEQEAVDRHNALRTCAKENIEGVRHSLDDLEALLQYPLFELENAENDLEIERQREEQLQSPHPLTPGGM